MKIHGTAKGGAISKKDFGVAFGGGAAPLVETTYEYAPTGSGAGGAVYDSDVSSTAFVGEGANTTDSLFYNSYVQSVNFYVFKVGTPTGTCKAVQMDESGQTVHEFWSKSVADLGTDNQVMSTESSTPSEVKFEQYHSLGMISTAGIKMGITIAAPAFDGSDTTRIPYNDYDTGSAARGTINTNYDMAFKVVVGR